MASPPSFSGQLAGPLWPVVEDVDLALTAMRKCGADQVLAMAREMTNALTPGCIYFGGTDPGRGLPTMLCSSPGDPFFVVTQNQLVEGRYLALLRTEFGGRIWLPGTNEVQRCFADYQADFEARQAQGKLIPGEDYRQENGHLVAQGQVAVMQINSRIAKTIFDHNPGHDFIVEESFPLAWMNPYLLPCGLFLKLNPQPVPALPASALAEDRAFRSRELAGKIGDWLTPETPLAQVCAYDEQVFARHDLSEFKGDPRFQASPYCFMAWAKWRTAIAGIYAWRLLQPPRQTPAERKELQIAADYAFRQAFALCPYSPESHYRYVNYLLQVNRLDDAILIGQTALACAPTPAPDFFHREQVTDLVSQLKRFKQPSAPH